MVRYQTALRPEDTPTEVGERNIHPHGRIASTNSLPRCGNSSAGTQAQELKRENSGADPHHRGNGLLDRSLSVGLGLVSIGQHIELVE